VEIVRKYLTPDEVSPANVRWNETTDAVQVTNDGSVWTDVPDIDPRHSDVYRLPALTGDARCDAAARIVALWQETLNNFVTVTDVAWVATWLAGIVVILTGGVGVLVFIIWAVIQALIGIGRNNIAAAFTQQVWDDILCIVFSGISTNGQVTSGQRVAIMTEIQATFGGVVWSTIAQLDKLYGEVLESNAGVTRTETGDCAACIELAWPRQFNFCNVLDDWTITCGTLTATGIEQVDNCSGSPSIDYIRATLAIPAGSTVQQVWVHVTGTNDQYSHIAIYWNGQVVVSVNNPSYTDSWFLTTGNALTGTHEMLIILDNSQTGKRLHIDNIRFYGTGDAPAFGHAESAPGCP